MRFASLIALAGVFALPSIGQSGSPLIGAGDQLHIEVFDTPELSTTARVNDHGDFHLLMGGNVHLAGLTLQQASEEVEHNLVHQRLMNTPKVMITVLKSATQNVTVYGQVVRPDIYEINTPRPLAQLITQAGGFTESADHHVTITHSNGKPTETIFLSNDGTTIAGQETFIYPGDSITVPKQGLIYVLGDVKRPGSVPMNSDVSGMTVLQAVSNAGGSANTAKGQALLIRREHGEVTKKIRLNLSAMQKGKAPDMAMKENDVVYVPFSFLKNAELEVTALAASATSAMITLK